MSRVAANPEMENINTKLDAVRIEQGQLFRKQRLGLTIKEQARGSQNCCARNWR